MMEETKDATDEKRDFLCDLMETCGIQATPEMAEEFSKFALQGLWNEYTRDWQEKSAAIQEKMNAQDIVFPNGTINKEYSQTFVIDDDELGEIEFEGLTEIGLNLDVDPETKTYAISGTPTEAGDFEIKMTCNYKGWLPGKDPLERVFRIAINPDPRTLWKNIPTDTSIEYYKPDTETTELKVGGGKQVVVASKRGRSHAHEGKPRDDGFKIDYDPKNQWCVLAVADGAGSAKYSREGSRIACETVVNHCRACLENPEDFEDYIRIYKQEGETEENRKWVGDNLWTIVGNAAFKAHRAIKEVATAKGAALKDYATTLLLTICKRFDFGWFVASFWVGDGAIGLYDSQKQSILLMGVPDGGEYAGQTRFLTMPEIFSDHASLYGRLKFTIVDDFTALFLLTDGVTDPLFETDANLGKVEKWNALWEEIDKAAALSDDSEDKANRLLEWLDFWSAGNHDDRTIAILF